MSEMHLDYYNWRTLLRNSSKHKRKVKWSENHSGVFNSLQPVDYTVHGILQARVLELVTFPFSRGFSQPGIEPRSPALQADSLPDEPQGKPKNTRVGSLSLLQGIFSTQESNGVSFIADRFLTNWALREALIKWKSWWFTVTGNQE